MLQFPTLEPDNGSPLKPEVWRARALEWLAGHLQPATMGQRVLAITFGDSGYFGILDSDFVHRFEIRDSRLLEAPLNEPFPPDDVRACHSGLGAAIQDLRKSGRIIRIPAPTEYAGNITLYGLPQ